MQAPSARGQRRGDAAPQAPRGGDAARPACREKADAGDAGVLHASRSPGPRVQVGDPVTVTQVCRFRAAFQAS